MKKVILISLFLTVLQANQCQLDQVSFCKNYICNGGFQEPVQTHRSKMFDTIPCWTTNKSNQFEIDFYNGQFAGSQFLELDASKGGQSYQQNIKVDEVGKYYLEFEYQTRPGVDLKDQAFAVYFNAQQVAYISPTAFERRKIKVEVECDAGENILRVQDRGTSDKLGNGVDNFALYKVSSLAVA